MSKIYLLSVSVILISILNGCLYQTVNKNDIEIATEICKQNNSEVVSIRAEFSGSEDVTCSNRKAYSLDSYVKGK